MHIRSKVDPFLSTFLSRPASSLPKGGQWAVVFEDLQGKILPAISLAYDGEPGIFWDTEDSASVILTDQYQTENGCLFCQAISLPGEGSTAVPEGIKANAYIRSYVGAGRNDFPLLRMSFLETNISFADTFLRGWAIATAKYGMIARSGPKNYRTNLYCYKYSVGPEGLSVRQKIVFSGICCLSVGDEEFNYDHGTTAMKRDAQFTYHSYSIDAYDGIDSLLLDNPSIIPG